jgi:ABC-type transport system substrate-binding protein
LAVFVAGCAEAPPATRVQWLFGSGQPEFDATAPPEFRRAALERLLTRTLVEEDSAGRVVPGAARSVEVSADSLTYTFTLRPGLRFTDDTPCTSEDFVRAWREGLERRDHQTWAWALSSVKGMKRYRAGRPPADLGLATPDEHTITIRLDQRDPLLLTRLAVPGISSAWRDASVKSWTEAIGLGPYRVLDAQPGRRMRLVLAPSPKTDQGREEASRFGSGREWALADTVVVRFAPTSAQARSFIRQDWPDLAWPLPPNLSEDALDMKYRLRMEPARPRRSLKLILRADVPPTTRREARRALAHGIARGEMVRRLGPGVDRRTTWVTGGSIAQPPVLDPDRIREWIERGRLGRSFGVSLAYRSDGPGVAITRQLQEEWSKHSIYVEPKPLPSGRFQAEALTGISHVLIVEHQPMVESVAAEMSGWVMPLRGPAVGPIRTGWRTREFDAGMAAGGPGVSMAAAEVRLAEELVVLPLADLDWTWAERAGRPNLPFHPRFGPLISSRSEVPSGRAR